MTVVLHYHGGPQDGNRRRIPEPKVGEHVARQFLAGVYTSDEPWDGVNRHVPLRFQSLLTGKFAQAAEDRSQATVCTGNPEG